MLPIDEMWEVFAFESLDGMTLDNMERWLSIRYPEAEWSITFNDSGTGVTVTPKFKSKEEQTFYLLKWS